MHDLTLRAKEKGDHPAALFHPDQALTASVPLPTSLAMTSTVRFA